MAKRSSIKIRSKRIGEKIQLRMLIAHPMQNGLFKDELGEPIPAHFIQEITIKLNDDVIMSGQLGASISKDPFFVFILKKANSGDKVTVSWIDNLQLSDTRDHYLA